MNDTVKKSILEMARGGFLEQVNYEMAKVLDNILDSNTKATNKRQIDIINTLSRHYGAQEVPLFVDDAESVTGPLLADTQVIRLAYLAQCLDGFGTCNFPVISARICGCVTAQQICMIPPQVDICPLQSQDFFQPHWM